MINAPNFEILKELSTGVFKGDLNFVVQTIFNEIKLFLNLEPFKNKIRFLIGKKQTLVNPEWFFNLGVSRYFQNDDLIIEVHEDYNKFLPFILLREIYNLFVPEEIKELELVQHVINQIILNDLERYDLKNEWRKLMISNLENYNLVSFDFIGFERLKSFFKLEGKNGIFFFFYYIRTYQTLISNKIEDIQSIFFDEFQNYFSKTMNDDDIIETVRCLILIFYRVRSYKDLLSFKNYFQEFKRNKLLITDLSLRKFSKNMDWIKKYSYIAPSYQINWKTLNTCVFAIFLYFNPVIKKSKIFKIITNFPFFVSPRISRSSLSLELFTYVVIPAKYLADLVRLIKKLANNGYTIRSHCLLLNSYTQNLNLNYFRDYSQNQRIINPFHQKYDKKYEIEFNMEYGDFFFNNKLNLLDFLLLDRIRFFNVSGLGFERKAETLSTIKGDLLNEISIERAKIKNLKNILNFFYTSDDLKKEIISFLESNKQKGFFYIKEMLEEFIYLINSIEEVLNNNKEIKDVTDFQTLVKSKHKVNLIEEGIMYNNIYCNIIILDIISLYSRSKKHFTTAIRKYKRFYDLIIAFDNLKLFDLSVLKNILKNRDLIKKIFQLKEQKLKNSYEKYKFYKITGQEIDLIIDKFVNHKPFVIQPYLINTIIPHKYIHNYLLLLLKDSLETKEKLKQFEKIFPRILILKTVDLINEVKLLYVEISIPFLNYKEKNQLFSIINNDFNNDLILAKLYLWSGYLPVFSIKNFYDLNKKQFFYTKDLFEQFFLLIKKTLGESLTPLGEESKKNQFNFWSRGKNLFDLVKKVNNRVFREKVDYNIKNLQRLSEFHLILKKWILDQEYFIETKKEFFFINHVKSIKFLPNFQHFGISQYVLYLYPRNMNNIDLKILLSNTFQNVKYPASLDSSNSLLIKYIVPNNYPNLKYLRWLVKSKKAIREYFGFFIKKIYQILHFDNNLSPKGWIYDKDWFKIHVQNIIFNTESKYQIKGIKEISPLDNTDNSYFDPESHEYDSLSQIYNWHSMDIKSYLGGKKKAKKNHIINLLKKNLIFPYLSLKNLNLHDKTYIILPNLKKKLNETLLKIFSFFNLAFIYEIQGEYFIHGFDQEVKFQNGLMIKLYFPKCEISEFLRVFELLFEYLEIENYIIINDLVDGKNLLKSIYGGLDFLKSYNPLKNLKWNEQKKRWMNPKVFTSKFEPIYPDLIPKEKK